MTLFPYGKAPFGILIVLAISLVVVTGSELTRRREKPDLVLATFSQDTRDRMGPVIHAFEARHGVRVSVEVVDMRALQNRLQAAMLAGTAVPDLVEMVDGTLGFFTAGPLEDCGFVDLTDRIHAEGYDRTLVAARFALWSSRGRIFAIPADINPLLLAYRKDITDALGIDVDTIQTWDDFARVGRQITRDLDGDGVPDRYALDLPMEPWGPRCLLIQAGGQFFDATGRLTMDSEEAVRMLDWYVRALTGPQRFGYACGWGPTLYKAMREGLAVFYFTTDWRAGMYRKEAPDLAGKFALMPLPAWEPGGRRISGWGGTGLAITAACPRRDLAWELIKALYLDRNNQGLRYRELRTLPSLQAAWTLPEVQAPDPFFGGQAAGAMFARFAPDAPPFYLTPWSNLAESKLMQVLHDGIAFFNAHGEDGLQECLRERLRLAGAQVQVVMDRNVFLKAASAPDAKD